VPGLVSVHVVSAKSSGASLPLRALSICALQAAKNAAKSIAPAFRTLGTTRLRRPSLPGRSTAIPTCSVGATRRCGLPSTSTWLAAMAGTLAIACTIAHATRCVKLTFGRKRPDW